jgi:hypothetical protein
MTETVMDRFETVARNKHDKLVEIYDALLAAPTESDDKAIYQRQSAGKALLTHIALLRKLLRLDAPGGAAARPETLDATAYRAMVAALDEVGEDG